MTYEKTPIKDPRAKISKKDAKRIANTELNQFSTMSMVWHIVKRHKTGLLAIWAITMTVAYMFPPAFDMLFGLIGR